MITRLNITKFKVLSLPTCWIFRTIRIVLAKCQVSYVDYVSFDTVNQIIMN